MIEQIPTLFQNQKVFFRNGKTLDYKFRKDQLQQLKQMLQKHESEIYMALKKDLNKSEQEAFTTEIGFLYLEIDHAIKNLKNWMQEEEVNTPITHTGTSSYIYKVPYGVTLVIAPWNYPLQLSLAPTIGAIAAGNCVVIKPSEHAPATSALLKKMIDSTFEQAYITVIEGEKQVSQLLSKQPFDYIFFTGSTEVGKLIMKQASDHLTPVTLELGGKSPAIVDSDANIKLAAKRIAWGKFTNAGQTCVAPDFVYVHKKVKKRFIKALKKSIRHFYGKKPLENSDYVRMIHKPHYTRLTNFLNDGTIIHGGNSNEEKLVIEPTIMDDVTWDDSVMQEEIFGPILPVMTFSKTEDVIDPLLQIDKPLALYYFGENKRKQEMILTKLPFGGGCFNDTLFHLANPHLPFGGIGKSGIGSYHGKYTFDTFTHQKSILKQSTTFDMPLRYPGGKILQTIVKQVMK